jgi:PIN domain nuclease of toxin-antitoxin system
VGDATVTLLVDTHAFIWAVAEPSAISAPAREAISTSAVVMVSAVTSFELALKNRLGKLPGGEVLSGGYASHVRRLGLRELDITSAHGQLAGDLEWDHRDPFDRLLAAQAILEGLTLVTKDPAFRTLPGLRLLW